MRVGPSHIMARGPRPLRTLLPLAVAALVAVLAVLRTNDPPRADASEARVVRVVDGDTIIARLGDGREERVRYIGIDTPESVKPNTPVQCFAKAASHENARLVE